MLPRVVIFDLDGTLWSPEMYELWGSGGAPFRAHPTRRDALIDKGGTTVALIGDSRSIMQQLLYDPVWKQHKTFIGLSSTCDEPTWAAECLSKLFLDINDSDKCANMSSLFEGYSEVYKVSGKSKHFKVLLDKIQKVDPTITDYSQFIFFDNQQDNIQDVTRLGVTCIYCPQGMVSGVWEKGLQKWRENIKRS